MNPKVSVIVPSFKHARYLRQRIDSILNQTFRDFELIILDDCSNDGSDVIIKSYRKDPHVTHIVINGKNSGSPFKQWHLGIHLAKGEWIWIAESDDYAELDFLERMMAAVADKPSVGLAYCDAWIVTEDAVERQTFGDLKNKIFKTDRWSYNYTNNGRKEIEDYLLGESTINNGSAVLFNAAVLKKMDPFNIPLRYIGDKYAYVKVMAFTDVVYVGQALNYYRNPFSTKHADRIIHYVHEQFKVFDWIDRNVPDIDRRKFFRAFYSNTDCSLFRNWNREKVSIFTDFLRINPRLFVKWGAWNLVRPFVTRINKKLIHKRSNMPV